MIYPIFPKSRITKKNRNYTVDTCLTRSTGTSLGSGRGLSNRIVQELVVLRALRHGASGGLRVGTSISSTSHTTSTGRSFSIGGSIGTSATRTSSTSTSVGVGRGLRIRTGLAIGPGDPASLGNVIDCRGEGISVGICHAIGLGLGPCVRVRVRRRPVVGAIGEAALGAG